MTRSAIVVGAGIAGLAAAIGLRRAGYSVTIVERETALAPAGAALSLWPNAIAALRRLGAAARIEREAAPIRSMRLSDRRDRAILEQGLPIGAEFPNAYLPTRALLQSALLEELGEVTLTLGARVDAVVQDEGSVRITMGTGDTRTADLAIMADGIWSKTATRLIGNMPCYRGYGGVLAPSESSGATPHHRASEYWGNRERFGLFDLAEGRRYWFYIRDQSENAPPPTLAEVDARMIGWPPGIVEAVAVTSRESLIPFAVYSRPAPKRLGQGRLLCVGDAAHAMEPNLGQGACQGIEDAAALGTLAARLPPEAILPAFEAARLPRIRSFVQRSAQGRWGAHAPGPVRIGWRTMLKVAPASFNAQVIRGMHRLPDYR